MGKILLDAFCCAGGATRGYQLAGYTVVGVDIAPQPSYCGEEFIQADAVEYIRKFGAQFDAIHASPPCQLYSATYRIHKNEHPDLIWPTREALLETGRPFVIENVEDAAPELFDPIMLCGTMFPELRVYRHRLFEAHGFDLEQPEHGAHTARQAKMGRPAKDGEFMHVVGNYSGAQAGRDAMGIDWYVPRGLVSEAIPPAYTQYVGGIMQAAMAA
jgi:DNA (cytosine-5)-methyltransferase 1